MSESDPTRSRTTDLSVVVPCYEDSGAIGRLFGEVGAALDAFDGRCEFVVVDDGSRDATTEAARRLAADFGHPVVIVRLARNSGQHAAIFAGFEESSGSRVVTLDSDLQYPPSEIPRLLDALDSGFRVASGVRVKRKDPVIRRLVTRFLGWWLGRQTGQRLADAGSMFRAYERDVVNRLMRMKEHRRFIPALVAWLGEPVCEVPIEHRDRPEGRSRYRMAVLVDMFLDLITGFSVAPLRVLSAAAFFGALLGFGATAAFGIYRVVIGGGVSGLVSAFALLFLLMGLQLLLLALIIEYVGRIYAEARQRPYLIVDEVVRFP